MISPQDAARLLELDKEPAARGRRRSDPLEPRLRAAWLQFQALRALALEAAPQPGERLLRAALERCRKSARRGPAASPDPADRSEAAESLALRPAPLRRQLPAWLSPLLALGVLGSVGLAFWIGDRSGAPPGGSPSPPTASAVPAPPAGVPFEFSLATPPVAEALEEPGDQAGGADADDVHAFSAVDRQASRLLREQLHQAQRRVAGTARTRRRAAAPVRIQALAGTAPGPAVPQRAAAPPATGTPTPPPSPGMTLDSSALWSAGPTPPSAAGSASGAAQGSGPATRILLSLELPQRRDIDARLFSADGLSRRMLASGLYGPGELRLTLTAQDDLGRPLAPGAYYLRVMTPWFSRVEPIQIH